MNKKLMTLAVIAAVALLALGYVAGTWHANTNGAATTASMGSEKEAGRKVLYWHDPMMPNQHFDKPGKSPFMNMHWSPYSRTKVRQVA